MEKHRLVIEFRTLDDLKTYMVETTMDFDVQVNARPVDALDKLTGKNTYIMKAHSQIPAKLRLFKGGLPSD